MEMERLSSSSGSSSGSQTQPFIPRRTGAFYRFTQKNLPACKPSWTTGCRSNKVAYIKDTSISKNCTRTIRAQNHMKAPVYIYYESTITTRTIDSMTKYVKSKKVISSFYMDWSTGTLEYSNGLPIVLCGLIAWSLFNDTYTFVLETVEMNVKRKNIAWESDRDHKYVKHVYPFNFQNGTLIGGGSLDPSISLNEHEDLIVWIRISAIPKFRKLYWYNRRGPGGRRIYNGVPWQQL